LLDKLFDLGDMVFNADLHADDSVVFSSILDRAAEYMTHHLYFFDIVRSDQAIACLVDALDNANEISFTIKVVMAK